MATARTKFSTVVFPDSNRQVLRLVGPQAKDHVKSEVLFKEARGLGSYRLVVHYEARFVDACTFARLEIGGKSPDGSQLDQVLGAVDAGGLLPLDSPGLTGLPSTASRTALKVASPPKNRFELTRVSQGVVLAKSGSVLLKSGCTRRPRS